MVLAILFFDKASIEGCREGRVVERHRQIRPFGLADFPPGCADVITTEGLNAEVRGVLAAFVAGDEPGLDIQSQGADGASEAVVLCGEGADVSHDVTPFGFSRSRLSRPLW